MPRAMAESTRTADRLSLRFSQILQRFRWAVIVFALLLAAACIQYARQHMGFVTRRSELIEADDRYKRLYEAYEQEFGETEELVVLIESPDPSRNHRCTDRLVRLLTDEPEAIKRVHASVDLRLLRQKALLFAPIDTLEEIRAVLQPVAPLLGSLSESPHLYEIFGAMRAQLRRGGTTASGDRPPLDQLALLQTPELIVQQMQQVLTAPLPPAAPSPWETLLGAGDAMPADLIRYNTLDDGRIYVVLIEPLTEEGGFTPYERAIRTVRDALAQLRRAFPDVTIGLTGKPVLNQDEFLSTQQDSVRASWLSLIGISLLFIIAFREVIRPMMTVTCLLIGVAWAMGFATLTVGHLNILSVTCTVFLINLGISYGIHLLARYEEELAGDRAPLEAIAATFDRAGPAILTSALTTAAAFFTMCLTRFRGIAELGIISGGGLILSMVAMLVVLPACLSCLRPFRGRILFGDYDVRHPHADDPRRRTRHARRWVLAAILITVGLGWRAIGRQFDYNLLNLQPANLESVQSELRLIHASGGEALYAVLTVETVDDLRRLAERTEHLPTVRRVDSVVPLLPMNQEEKLAIIHHIQTMLAQVETEQETRRVDVPRLRRTLGQLKRDLELGAWYVQRHELTEVAPRLQEVAEAIEAFLRRLEASDPATTAIRLGHYQHSIFGDLWAKLAILKAPSLTMPVTLDDLPPALRERYVGRTGKFVLRAYPTANIWERPALEAFINDLRAVSPDWTGTPVNIYEYTGLLKRSYEQAAWYALIAIALLLWAHFRRLPLVLLALSPLLLGVVWMVGVMAWLGLSFNAANIMTLPLILGAGVDNGVHILQRFREDPDAAVIRTGAGRSIILTSLVSIIGFASLATADHRGIASLGTIMTIGIGATTLAALAIFPPLLHLIHQQTPLTERRA